MIICQEKLRAKETWIAEKTFKKSRKTPQKERNIE